MESVSDNKVLRSNGIEAYVLFDTFVILNGRCVFAGDIQNVRLDAKKQHCVITGWKDEFYIVQLDDTEILRIRDIKRQNGIVRVVEYDAYKKLPETVGVILSGRCVSDDGVVYVKDNECILEDKAIYGIWIHAKTKKVAYRGSKDNIYIEGKWVSRQIANVVWSPKGRVAFCADNRFYSSKDVMYLDGKLFTWPEEYQRELFEFFFSVPNDQPIYLFRTGEQVIIRRKEDNWMKPDITFELNGVPMKVVWMDDTELIDWKEK